jgi:hypothetical protein
MAVRYQLVINCVGRPEPLARFWAEARKERVDAEARRLCDLGATLLSDLSEELGEGLDHYAVALRDPEGNEFDIN